MTESHCGFCELTQFRAADVYIENAVCLYASTRDLGTRLTCFQDAA